MKAINELAKAVSDMIGSAVGVLEDVLDAVAEIGRMFR